MAYFRTFLLPFTTPKDTLIEAGWGQRMEESECLSEILSRKKTVTGFGCTARYVKREMIDKTSSDTE
jgi:hypothetical protein